MADAVVIVGTALQVGGTLLLLVQVAIIRSREFGKPTPWARLLTWIRSLLGRPQVVLGGASMSCGVAVKGRGTVRPAAVAPDATTAERIARLERYVEHIDRDIEEAHIAIDRKAQELTEAAEQREAEVRQEIEQRDEQRRAALRPALRWQVIGAWCIVVGLCLATLGGVL